jgi:hypothetical protein
VVTKAFLMTCGKSRVLLQGHVGQRGNGLQNQFRDRLPFSQRIGAGVVEDTALLQPLSQPHGGWLDELLDLVIGV